MEEEEEEGGGGGGGGGGGEGGWRRRRQEKCISKNTCNVTTFKHSNRKHWSLCGWPVLVAAGK